MSDSPIHVIINNIRRNYSGKNVSLIDIRMIEEKYRICSLVNTKNDNISFVRITSYGLDGVFFEDVILNIDGIVSKTNDIHNYIFNMNKALYELIYGVYLIDSNELLIKELIEPDINFEDLHTEMIKLKERVSNLELKLNQLSETKDLKPSLFDYDNKNIE